VKLRDSARTADMVVVGAQEGWSATRLFATGRFSITTVYSSAPAALGQERAPNISPRARANGTMNFTALAARLASVASGLGLGKSRQRRPHNCCCDANAWSLSVCMGCCTLLPSDHRRDILLFQIKVVLVQTRPLGQRPLLVVRIISILRQAVSP